MFRRSIALALALIAGTIALTAQGRIKQYGRATVEYRSDDVSVVANYDYSQKKHADPWLLIDVAIQGRRPIVIQRSELKVRTPDERIIALATQQQFLEDVERLAPLFQNATIFRRSLDDYFPSRPSQRTVNFFSTPGGLVMNSVMTHVDEVAAGSLLFKSADGKWPEGTYHLVLDHDKAKADLPIMLQ